MSYSPDLTHITKKHRDTVYPPSVDTFLLIDSIVGDLEFIKELEPAIVLEVGVGCGAVLAAVAAHLSPHALYLGIDINLSACELAVLTLDKNKAGCAEVLRADFLSGVNLKSKVDVLICNPPYVATSSEEYTQCQGRRDISSSFAGGEDGREFIDSLIACKGILSEEAIVYLLYEEHNGTFGGVTLSEERRGCEGLRVVRLTKREFGL